MAALAVAFLLAAGHPCEADAQRLCQGTEPGGGGIARCLKQHESELSGACKAKREGFREHAAEVRAAGKKCRPWRRRCARRARTTRSGSAPGCSRAALLWRNA